MIDQDRIADVMGATVYGPDEDKIGKVGQVFLDDQTGNPEWITVATGLFGTRETFVPIAQAEFNDGNVSVPYDKAKVKDAPNIDVDEGHISPEAEAELYEYYGMPYEQDAPGGQLPTDDGGRQPEAGTEEARRSRLRRHAAATGGGVGAATGTAQDAPLADEDRAYDAGQSQPTGGAESRPMTTDGSQQDASHYPDPDTSRASAPSADTDEVTDSEQPSSYGTGEQDPAWTEPDRRSP
ncbi:hypothetical protein BH20ACT5_BH20ACT5_25070 [soil metagenome]